MKVDKLISLKDDWMMIVSKEGISISKYYEEERKYETKKIELLESQGEFLLCNDCFYITSKEIFVWKDNGCY